MLRCRSARSKSSRNAPTVCGSPAAVSKTSSGDEILELVNDQVLNGLSVGFSPVRQEWTDRRTKRTHTESRLHEVSLCEQGAYADALVTAVRSSGPARAPLDLYQRRLSLLTQRAQEQ